MLSVSQTKYPHLSELSYQLKIGAGASLVLFLFYLFFQPFSIVSSDFNLQLYFYAGFGLVSLIFTTLSIFILPIVFKNRMIPWKNSNLYDYLLSVIIWILVSTASCFYSYYIWTISLSLDVLFKVILISLFPGLIYFVAVHFRTLKLSLDINKDSGAEVEHGKIRLYQAGNLETLTLNPSQILFLHSASNYVEIVYKEDSDIRKELIRTTLKQMEAVLKAYTNFIICHRTYIVNLDFVEKLAGDAQSKKLILQHDQPDIPVSRQYLALVKKALESS